MTAEKGSVQMHAVERLLVVQCCHLPQFFHLVEKLRARHPEWSWDALVVDALQVRFYLDLFPGLFDRIHFFAGCLPTGLQRYERVVFPLLNRGYWRIKRAAASIGGEAWEADYGGQLRPLSRRRLGTSAFLALHKATQDFDAYFRNFPHRPLGEKILLVESCHPSLVAGTREAWGSMLPARSELRRVGGTSLLENWKVLRRSRFDAAIVFFSGESGFAGLKMLPFLLRLPKILIVNENGHHLYATAGSLARFLYQRVRYGPALPKPQPAILFIQTESPPYVIHAIEKLRQDGLFPGSEIALLCREQDRSKFQPLPGISRLFTYSRNNWRANLQLLRRLRSFSPDVVSAIFSGRRVFAKQKLSSFFFLDRPLLAFNARLDCYWVTPRTIARLFRREPLLFDDPSASRRPPPRVLFIQTEGPRYVRHALEKLKREDHLFPESQVALLCREEDRDHFDPLPGISLFVYSRGHWRRKVQLWRRLRAFSPQVVSAIFSGRRVFSKQKLFFFLFWRRPLLAFNARLDCYWVTPRTIARLFRREPLLFDDPSHSSASEVLLIQTETTLETCRAIDVLISGRVAETRRVAVLCPADQRRRFQQLPAVETVYTYQAGKWRDNLKTLRALTGRDRDVIAALFSGRPVFRLQKLLFFLLPARHRLVFNQSLDCSYLKWGRYACWIHPANYARLSSRQAGSAGGLRLVARKGGKTLLFLPRFVYLLSWVTLIKLRRGLRAR